MAIHRIFTDDPLDGLQAELTVGGDEAFHAIRVKRIQPQDPIQVLDGQGRVADCTVSRADKIGRDWILHLKVAAISIVPAVQPAVEIVSAAPKGDRFSTMIEGLSQVGARSWSLLDAARLVNDPSPLRLDRVERIAAESSKQCGRAWRLAIGPAMSFDAALRPSTGVALLADAGGEPYQRTGSDHIRLLVGPEGGWTPAELAAARQHNIRSVRFGPHIMRIETAAVVGAATVLSTETLPADRQP